MPSLAGNGVAVVRAPDYQGVLIQPQLLDFIHHQAACRVQKGSVGIAVGKDLLPVLPWQGVGINDVLTIAQGTVDFHFQRIWLVVKVVPEAGIFLYILRLIPV